MKKGKLITIGGAIVVLALCGYFFMGTSSKGKISFQTEKVTRNSMTDVVVATGTVEPVTKVDVGTQVSGVRAVKATVMSKLKKSQGGTQGGSTITMQLAKLIYMQPKQTWQYKVKQMFLAWELEKRYSKDKIMEFYLNNVYFANGYYGIDAACHGYPIP